jgi:hypothetical protein
VGVLHLSLILLQTFLLLSLPPDAGFTKPPDGLVPLPNSDRRHFWLPK